MVCQVDYCFKKGEKKIRDFLLTMCLVLPALEAFLSMFFLDNLRGFLICNGRQEIFHWKLDSSLEDIFDAGVLILLPIYHPYRIAAIILGSVLGSVLGSMDFFVLLNFVFL